MDKSKKDNSSLKQSSVPQKKEPAQITRVTQYQFSGVIPHPDILYNYDQIIPGAAERILKMAEDDAKHQREIEKSALQISSNEVNLTDLSLEYLPLLPALLPLYLVLKKQQSALVVQPLLAW